MNKYSIYVRILYTVYMTCIKQSQRCKQSVSYSHISHWATSKWKISVGLLAFGWSMLVGTELPACCQTILAIQPYNWIARALKCIQIHGILCQIGWVCFHVAAICLPLEVRTEVSRRTAGVPTWAGLAKQCFFLLPAPARQYLGWAGICLPSRCRSHLRYFLEKGVM